MKKFFIAAYIILVLLINSAEALAASYSYIDANGNEVLSDNSNTRAVGNSLGLWTWEVVNENKTLANQTITQDLNLILCDGKELTINGRIQIANGKTLRIYSQKEGTGKLIISPSSGLSSICAISNNTANYVQYGGRVSLKANAAAALVNLNAWLNGGIIEFSGTEKAMNNVNLTLAETTTHNGSLCISYTTNNNMPEGGNIKIADNKNLFFDDDGQNISLSGTNKDFFRAVNGKILVTALRTSFDANNGTDSADVQYFTEPDITQLKANNFTLKGYEFNGWNTRSDAQGTSYQDKASITPADVHKKTLYAQWKIIDYAINYDLDGGINDSENPNSYTINTDTITLKSPSRAGYTFNGWTLDGSAVTGIIKGSTGNKTFKANWTANNYTIKYNANNSSGSMQNQEFTYNASQNLTANSFTRTGYTFKNWSTKPDGSGTSYTDGQSINNLTEENNAVINLYAQWEIITYSINYNLDGGSANNPASYNIETDSFTLNNPSKANYEFTGWTGTDLTELTQTVTINKGSTGERTYTANYKANLKALDVNISGTDTITLEKGSSHSEIYSAAVNASYYDDTTRTLSAGEYSLTWTLSENISGISINENGVLIIPDSLESGTYNIAINAMAASHDINAANSKQVNIIVKAAALEALSVTISGLEIISLDQGTSGSADYYVTVNAFYSDGTSKILSEDDYSIIYALSEDISGIYINNGGRLIISDELKAKSYDITITAQVSSHDIKGTSSKHVIIYVKAPILESLDVTITGSEALTLNAGTSRTAKYSVTVKASYSDGNNKTLSEGDCSLKWTLDKNISGITINDKGILTLSDSVKSGNYSITITVQAAFNGIKSTALKRVNVSVKASTPELKALNVTLSGSESLTLNAGTSRTAKYSVIVKASYSDGNNKTLSESECSLRWTLDKNISGITINNKGVLTLSDSLKSGNYSITITAQASYNGIKGNASKRVNISVKASAPTLKALNVNISGSEAITLNAGDNTTAKYSVIVKASYSDGNNKTLSESECSLRWTLDKNISGITINDKGVLTLSDSLEPGNYSIKITAKMSIKNITGKDTITVNISVKAPEGQDDSKDNYALQEYDSRVTADYYEILNLSPEAKNAVTYLELHGDIINLSDIDFTGFTSLITLDLSNAENLETADLSILPDTVKEVNLSGTSITSLTLTGSNVQIINANDCENLEGLDAQGLTSLYELNVSNTGISSLNLTDCVNLAKLDCSSCELDSEGLILEGCENLEYLDISSNHFMYFDAQDSLNEFGCSDQKVFIYESSKHFDLNRGGVQKA
ncbi:MAG: InlB B-repeat-containing protein [Synergistaceae bacterium]|nr:InlB B-repeat-containing protein [Synergistaceae bacterium]